MKTKFGALPYLYPLPIILVGTVVNQKPNYATLGDCGLMGINPALVCISLHEKHYTTSGIINHGTFSINVPEASMLQKVDLCGIISGREFDKAALFQTFYGELGTAPMIEETPVNLECKVIHEVTVKHRHIFIGEVFETYVSDEYVVLHGQEKKIVDLQKLNPIMYALDNNYYGNNGIIGKGCTEGRGLLPR